MKPAVQSLEINPAGEPEANGLRSFLKVKNLRGHGADCDFPLVEHVSLIRGTFNILLFIQPGISIMKALVRQLFVLTGIALLSCSATSPLVSQDVTKSILKGSDLKPLGRFAVRDGQLEMIGSAMHFGVAFEGTEITLITSTDPAPFGYLQYELDGIYQRRVRVEQQAGSIKVTAPDSGTHTLWVYKATEASSGPIFIREIQGQSLKVLEVPAKPLMEFIGNSITCGAAADPSEIPCGAGSYHDQHNAYMAYGPRIARALNANIMLTSVSGIGIYRNWNSDGPTMPQVFQFADLKAGSSRAWNFATASPAVVSIALGTNDFSNGDGKNARLPFDSATFTRTYVDFVRTVRSKYPKSKIVLLNSPMVSGTRNEIFVACLYRVKRQIDASFPNDLPVSVFLFRAMKARGCGGHPNVEDHGIMAEQMIERYRQLLDDK
ncbi:MAG TPA: GDSL-type esterase/lipase family protein [Chryseosolibacter sp.]